MRILVFAPYAHWQLHVTDLELIQSHVDAGDEVTVLTCQGQMLACDNNPQRRPYRCIRCIGRSDAGLRLINGDFQAKPYYWLSDDEQRQLDLLNTDFANLSALQETYVENFDIGWAVLSSLITRHRDSNVNLQDQAFELEGLMKGAWSVYYSLRRHLREHPVDRVYVFNGRYASLRAALRASQAESTDCYVHDVGRDRQHYELYANTLPHDYQYITQQVNTAWDAHEGRVYRDSLAARWYRDRAQGLARSGKSFVDHQIAGCMPPNWDADRRNVVCFTSSEDEFAAIGESWQNPLYESQLDGLQRIVRDLIREDLHLYVRMHPNLKGVENEQTRGLRNLDAANLTVIPADHPVSTYTLMQQADTVLTFGSTAGIEAVYWGKPSVLAGIAFYRELGGTYNPSHHQELVQLLRRSIPSRDSTPALKYGFYRATFGRPYQHYVPSPSSSAYDKGRFNGRRIRSRPSTWIKSRLAKAWPDAARARLKAA